LFDIEVAGLNSLKNYLRVPRLKTDFLLYALDILLRKGFLLEWTRLVDL